ncbi:hypothetical protein K474DRAFT_1714125 [Panus rudis PR-1116 ss-1]|nr:hypothetical protein K474DRAFT_1714125 [Panus rudis PR-1116 ss-1]
MFDDVHHNEAASRMFIDTFLFRASAMVSSAQEIVVMLDNGVPEVKPSDYARFRRHQLHVQLLLRIRRLRVRRDRGSRRPPTFLTFTALYIALPPSLEKRRGQNSEVAAFLLSKPKSISPHTSRSTFVEPSSSLLPARNTSDV